MLLGQATRSASAFSSRLLPGRGRLSRPLLAKRVHHVVYAIGSTTDVRAPEAYEIILSGVRVLDVRTVEEYAAGHVSGAVNIPIYNMSPMGMAPNPSFLQQVKDSFPDLDEQIVVHCKSGVRSRTASDYLKAEYDSLVHMDDGWMGWLGAGLPVEK